MQQLRLLLLFSFSIIMSATSCTEENNASDEENSVIQADDVEEETVSYYNGDRRGVHALFEPDSSVENYFDEDHIAFLTLDKCHDLILSEGQAVQLTETEKKTVQMGMIQIFEDQGSAEYELKDYYLQFFAAEMEDRHILIHVNAMCWLHDEMNWHERHIMVEDGGACYFSVYIDLTAMEYFGYSQNGLA